MKPTDIVDAYVLDVMRYVPRRSRHDIGLELRDLLTQMLAEKAEIAGRVPDQEMALAMLTDFGLPRDIAARYTEADVVIIPADQTKTFAMLAIGGVGLQWLLSLPAVFHGAPLASWWFSSGLGALWWPGFLVVTSIIVAWVNQTTWFKGSWRPRIIDYHVVNRGAFKVGLFLFATGAVLMAGLPFIVDALPAFFPDLFAFNPDFLATRAPFAVLLWLSQFVLLYYVFTQGNWSVLTRRLHFSFDVAWLALLGWWLSGEKIFQMPTTDEATKSALGFVMFIIVLTLAFKLYRQRARLYLPNIAA
jgi:hypothetical protein